MSQSVTNKVYSLNPENCDMECHETIDNEVFRCKTEPENPTIYKTAIANLVVSDTLDDNHSYLISD